MRGSLLSLLLTLPLSALAQSSAAYLPAAPMAATVSLAPGTASADPGSSESLAARQNQQQPLVDPATAALSITRTDAERVALKNNPRITASHLLALAAGQVTRETRSGELPQISGAITAEKAEDGSRIGAGALTDSRIYTHAGAGGSLSQLITDFGHTRDLVATNKLQQKAQDQTALATEQDVLLATDEAFYRLLDAQSLLDVAKATVAARGDVENLISALTRNALKSDLDLNIASADLSQSQLLELDAENGVASASAALAAVLATPVDRLYHAVEDPEAALPPPPSPDSSAVIRASALAQRPDLQALRLNAAAGQKFAMAQQLQHLPTISALALGGITPVAPDGVFIPNWYAAGGVNLSLPLFTGFRIDAQTQEARLRQKAAEKRVQELSDNIGRDVRVAILNAQTAFRRISVADQFRQQTAQALALAQTRYKLGLSSIVELSQAQLQSTQAAVAAVNARYDYLLALRSLDYARGGTCSIGEVRFRPRGLSQRLKPRCKDRLYGRTEVRPYPKAYLIRVCLEASVLDEPDRWQTKIVRKKRKSMKEGLKIETIVFATDLLENSRLALDYVVAFAEHFNATIHMLHVVQLSGAAYAAELEIHRASVSRLTAEERLHVLAAGVSRLGLRVETEVVDGLTGEMILDGVTRHKADLLVLGVHGVHRGVEHLLIGSTTEKIMLSALCPILTVGAHVLTGFDIKLHVKEILLFSDFTPESVSAAPYALMLGREFGMPVDVCQLLPAVATGNDRLRKQLAEDYCGSIQGVMGDDAATWCEPAFQLERGMQLEQIVDRAESQHAGLIVLGTHTESFAGRRLHSSFAYQVLGRATCPVFTIPRLR